MLEEVDRVASKMGKALFSLLVLILIFACLGCGEKVAAVDVQRLTDDVLAAQVDVKSYRLGMKMIIDTSIEVECQEMDETMSLDAGFVIDEVNKEMKMTMSADMEATGDEPVTLEMDMYLVDNTIYVQMDILDERSTWMKQEVPTDFWEAQATIYQQLELLQTSDVKYLRDDTVNGVECYLLESIPNLGQLWQTAMEQPWMEEVPMGIPNMEDVIKKVSVKQWIAKDTLFLTKVQIQMTMLLTSEDMGVPEEDGKMSMSVLMDIWAYDYNEPVSIELPAQAEAAIEVPSSNWST